MSTTYQDIEHKYNEFCKRYREIQVKQEYQAISEADLYKLELKSLDKFYDEFGQNILLDSIAGFPIVIQTHALQKGKRRFIGDYNLRCALHITKEPNYLDNIKEIIITLFTKYRKLDGKKAYSLKDVISSLYNEYFASVPKSYDDTYDDIPIKFALYSFVEFDGKIYCVEMAVAAAITMFTYHNTPLDYMKRLNRSYIWDSLVALNDEYTKSHNGRPFLDLNAQKFGPVLNITSYATWVKNVRSTEDLEPLNSSELKHIDIFDIFTPQLIDSSYLFAMPYEDKTVYPIDKETFKNMCLYETSRLRNKGEQ